MSDTNYNCGKLEELLLASVSGSFPKAEREELNAMLRNSVEARCVAIQSLSLDADLSEILADHAREHPYAPASSRPPSTVPRATGVIRTRWFARAAAWFGAFHFWESTARAATTTASSSTANFPTLFIKTTLAVAMTKSTSIAITSAILLAGGGVLVLIHHGNQQAIDRIEELQARKKTLDATATDESARPGSTTGPRPAPLNPTVRQQLADWVKLFDKDRDSITMKDVSASIEFYKKLSGMDAPSLKEMLLEAERMGDVPSQLVMHILHELAQKSPADAATLGGRIAAKSAEFNRLLTGTAGNAFEKWLKTDPAAANAWYLGAVASSELVPKAIPPQGEEDFTPDRLFARIHFAALLKSKPTDAEGMIGNMSPEDAATTVSSEEDPALVARITRLLPPSQQVAAATDKIQSMAEEDIKAAIEWGKSLEIGETQRATLLATAVNHAHAEGKLDLNGVAGWAKSLDIGAQIIATMPDSPEREEVKRIIENKSR